MRRRILGTIAGLFILVAGAGCLLADDLVGLIQDIDADVEQFIATLPVPPGVD